MNATFEELNQIPDIGEIIAKSIIDFFQNEKNRDIIEELKELKVGMEYTGPKVVINEFQKDNIFHLYQSLTLFLSH